MFNIIACTIVLIAFPILSFAGSYQIIYQEQIPGAEKYSLVKPLLDNSQTITGFVYVNSSPREVIVDRWAADSVIRIPHEHATVDLETRLSEDGDTLVIYVVEALHSAEIRAHYITNNLISTFIAEPDYFYRWDGWISEIESLSLEFEYDSSGKPTGLIFQSQLKFMSMDATWGYQEESVPTSIVYSLDLTQQWFREDVAWVHRGNLTGTEQQETCSISKGSSVYHCFNVTCTGWSHSWSSMGVYYENTSLIIPGTFYSILIDRFIPGSDYDQILYYALAIDPLGRTTSAEAHLALLDFSSGSMNEVWYNPTKIINPKYVFHTEQIVAGLQGNNKAIFLDYITGSVSDPVELDRSLASINYFETGADNSTLNLLGRNHDTLFIYQFDTPTAIETAESVDVLPNEFVLHPNHPNPFNGETTISFDLIRKQQIKLTIFNIIGQEITTLIDRTMSAGTHRVVWNGLDRNGNELPSGVYLTRLTSGEQSATTKMLYLK